MTRLLAASALSVLALAEATPAVMAQYSPNCERNGRRDFCAYTPGPDPAGGGLAAGRMVFADHRVYGLQRDERSGRDRCPVRPCMAAPYTHLTLPTTSPVDRLALSWRLHTNKQQIPTSGRVYVA